MSLVPAPSSDPIPGNTQPSTAAERTVRDENRAYLVRYIESTATAMANRSHDN